jgi:hypothetical protein
VVTGPRNVFLQETKIKARDSRMWTWNNKFFGIPTLGLFRRAKNLIVELYESLESFIQTIRYDTVQYFILQRIQHSTYLKQFLYYEESSQMRLEKEPSFARVSVINYQASVVLCTFPSPHTIDYSSLVPCRAHVELDGGSVSEESLCKTLLILRATNSP